MTQNQNLNGDYEADIRFGQWLKTKRESVGLTIEQAAADTGIAAQRIKSLEMGYAERGIMPAEAKRLAGLYRVELKELMEKAVEGTD